MSREVGNAELLLAGLARAEQFARAAQLKILLCDVKAVLTLAHDG